MRRLAVLLITFLAGLIVWVDEANAAPGSRVDLVLTAHPFQGDMVEIVTVDATRWTCDFEEGHLSSLGVHKLLRFGTTTANIGDGDLRLGDPTRNPDLFSYNACHDHYHLNGYAEYHLFDANGVEVGIAHKIGFCLVDLDVYDPTLVGTDHPFGRFLACENQGISSGWYDTYWPWFGGQWIEIDNVPPGSYTLVGTVNPNRVLPESDYTNNTRTIPVVVP